MNIDLAVHLASELYRLGVREVCLCAGARNSPLVTVFSSIQGFRLFHFFEERSAAFFALGRIKSQHQPVAVVTTSGTAVAELLPAAMEAYYTGLPLVLVTADRPRRYRGTGAPQAVEQVGIFGPYVRCVLDWTTEELELFKNSNADFKAFKAWDFSGPIQINLCFEEPLLDRELTPEDQKWVTQGFQCSSGASGQASGHGDQGAEVSSLKSAIQSLKGFLQKVERPLVIVGGLNRGSLAFRKSLVDFLLQLRSPVYLEATSGLRECPELEPIRIQSTDRLLESLESFAHPVDGVLRLGGVPTLRFWRDLENKRADLPVLSVSDCPFAGSARSELAVASMEAFFTYFEWKNELGVSQKRQAFFSDLFEVDRKLSAALLALLEEEPTSECGMIHALSKLIPAQSRVYLGNSLPIREWDLAAIRAEKGFVFGANRGANGIDGQVSSFLGFSEPGQENWALLGDLTTLYDLSAPWILDQIPELDIKLVVMNNGGGKIFSRMFKNPVFQNQHALSFEPWAKMWALSYQFWKTVPEAMSGSGNQLIELRPDADATARFWNRYAHLVRAALQGLPRQSLK